MQSDPVRVTDTYSTARRFQMWRYEVGHRQLLLRSVKGNGLTTRIDVLFKNVHQLHLPTSMTGMTITRGEERFSIVGEDWSGHVNAAACFVAEDEGEHFDPSPFAASLRQDP